MGYKSECWWCCPVGWLWCLGLVGTVIAWECCCVCALCLLYCLRLYHGCIFVWCLGDVVVGFVGWVLIIYDVVSLWCHWVCIRYVGLWCVRESGCLNMWLYIIIVIGQYFLIYDYY